MELIAAIEALRSCSDAAEIELHTDSQYVRRGITEWVSKWKRRDWSRGKNQPVLNKELWMALDYENQRVNVTWHWVKAHAGHALNEQVDDAAREAALAAHASVLGQDALETTESTAEIAADRSVFFIAVVNDGDADGACAWTVIRSDADHQTTDSVIETASTSNRALVSAALFVLDAQADDAKICVYTDAEYLIKGVTEWLASWKLRNWRKSDRKPVVNADLWQALDAQIQRVDVVWRSGRSSEQASSILKQAKTIARDELAEWRLNT